MYLPMQRIRFPLTKVAFPALSTFQDDQRKFREYFEKLIGLMTFIYMPLVMYLGINSENIILLVLGEKWIDAAAIFRILAFASFIGPVSSMCDLVLQTCGLTRKYLLWGTVSSIIYDYFICRWSSLGGGRSGRSLYNRKLRNILSGIMVSFKRHTDIHFFVFSIY